MPVFRYLICGGPVEMEQNGGENRYNAMDRLARTSQPGEPD